MKKLLFLFFIPGGLQISVGQTSNTGDEDVFVIAEKMPVFIGGESSKNEFIQKNFQYPAIEKEFGVQGTVYVTFIIEKDGSISNVRCLRGIKNGPALNKEAIRVVSSMPKWQPGTQNNRPVRIQYNMPVKCILKDVPEITDQQLEKIADNHYKKGKAFADKKMYAEALAEFDYTVFYKPSDINTLLERGKAFHNLKKDQFACDEWNKIKFLGSSQADEMLTKYCK